MDNFHDLIINRRSIRKYTDQQIDPEYVKLIIEAGLMAPTSKSSRSWQFIVVEDKDMLERLGNCKPSYATSIARAPLAIVVAADPAKSDAWIEDASVATAYMQLQASDLGLGSCWVQVRDRYGDNGMPSEEYVQEALGMPDTISVLCILSIGYKDEVRKPLDPEKVLWENVHIGKW